MTRKHFIALAEALRRTKPTREQLNENSCDISMAQWLEDVEAVAQVCAKSNPRFNNDVFIGYIAGTCGKNGGKHGKA